ncbi:MAG: siderophore-interacting protein [Streptosporangiaceae bacterium]
MTEAPVQRRTVGGTFRTGGTVTDIEQITPRMRRIRVEGPDVARLTSVPGQQVRVFVTELRDPRNWLRPKDFLRTYSIWRHDDGLELCALDHGGDGPGERWTRELSVGDTISFMRPEGSFTLHGEDTYHVFAGEETAAVAFGAMLRALPADVPAYGVIEVDEPADQLPLDRELSWLYRHGRAAASSETLVNALAELPLPSSPGVAYLAGEARTIQMLRRHLVSERGWPRQSVHTKPFWTPGKRGLD